MRHGSLMRFGCVEYLFCISEFAKRCRDPTAGKSKSVFPYDQLKAESILRKIVLLSVCDPLGQDSSNNRKRRVFDFHQRRFALFMVDCQSAIAFLKASKLTAAFPLRNLH